MNLVEQQIILSFIDKQTFDIRKENFGISEFFVLKTVERHFDYVVAWHAARQQVIFEQREQQIRFAASPYACDYLYKSIVFLAYEQVKIPLPLELHIILLRQISVKNSIFLS